MDMPLKPNVLEDMARDVSEEKLGDLSERLIIALACASCSEAKVLFCPRCRPS